MFGLLSSWLVKAECYFQVFQPLFCSLSDISMRKPLFSSWFVLLWFFSLFLAGGWGELICSWHLKWRRKNLADARATAWEEKNSFPKRQLASLKLLERNGPVTHSLGCLLRSPPLAAHEYRPPERESTLRIQTKAVDWTKQVRNFRLQAKPCLKGT